MKGIISEITPIVAMFITGAVLITCIINNLNHGIVYGGLSAISGIGGYTVGKYRTLRRINGKQASPRNNQTPS